MFGKFIFPTSENFSPVSWVIITTLDIQWPWWQIWTTIFLKVPSVQSSPCTLLTLRYWLCMYSPGASRSFLDTSVRAGHSVPSVCIWNEMLLSVKKKVTFIYCCTHSRQMTYYSLQFLFSQNVFYCMNCTLPFSVAALTTTYNMVKCSFLWSFRSYKPKIFERWIQAASLLISLCLTWLINSDKTCTERSVSSQN